MGFDAGSLTAYMRLDTAEFLRKAEEVKAIGRDLAKEITPVVALDVVEFDAEAAAVEETKKILAEDTTSTMRLEADTSSAKVAATDLLQAFNKSAYGIAGDNRGLVRSIIEQSLNIEEVKGGLMSLGFTKSEIADMTASLGTITGPGAITGDRGVASTLAADIASHILPTGGEMERALTAAEADSSGGGIAGGTSNWLDRFFTNRIKGTGIEGKAFRMMGLPGWAASSLAVGLPLVVSFATAAFAAAAGLLALGIAAAPTFYAIGKGVSAVNSANDALAIALPGTTQWVTAVQGLGTAWQSIPARLQPAVQGLLNLFSGNSPMMNQVQGWAALLVQNITKALSSKGGGSVFQPLILTTERAVNTLMGGVFKGSGTGLRHFILSLSKMTGPAILGFATIFKDIFKIFGGFGAAAGSSGFKTIIQFFNLLATIAHSALFEGFVKGWVGFDRAILTVIGDLFRVLNLLASIGLNVKGIGTVAGAVTSLALTYVYARGILSKLGVLGGGAAAGAGAGAGGEVAAVAGGGFLARIFGGAGGVGILAAVSAGVAALANKVVQHLFHPGPDVPLSNQWLGDAFKRGMANFKNGWAMLMSGQLFGGGGAVGGGPGLGGPHYPKNPQYMNDKGAGPVWKSPAQWAAYLKSLGIPVAKFVSDTQQALDLSSQQIGVALAGDMTGFKTFTVGATQSVTKMLSNLTGQNNTLATWARDAQILLNRHLNPGAVADLAQTMPQDLAKMVKASNKQLTAFNVQWYEHMFMAQMIGKNGVRGLTNAVLWGLKKGGPLIRQAAINVAKAMNLPIPGVISAWQLAMLHLQQIIGGTFASISKMLTPGSGTAALYMHARIPGHAAGGWMAAGEPGIVGESGPELFVPHSSGYVVPNGAFGHGGGGSIGIYVDARGSNNPMAVEQAARTGVTQALPAFRLALARGAGA